MEQEEMTIEEENKICEMFENVQPEDLVPLSDEEQRKMDRILTKAADKWFAKNSTSSVSTPADSRIKVPA